MSDRPTTVRTWRFVAAFACAAMLPAASGCFALSLDGEGRIDNPITGARLSNLESRVTALEQMMMPPGGPIGPAGAAGMVPPHGGFAAGPEFPAVVR